MSNTQNSQLELARNFIASYKGELIASLPSHLTDKGIGWMTSALSALRRDPNLLVAANRDPASLITALSQAAQLGLMPGTEEYWLTIRSGKILGIVGYVGYVELMYRAGAVSAVIVELVHEKDGFEFTPGINDRPIHHIDHFGERGKIIGAYAYAVMKDGATSKVVIVDKNRIARAMDASSTAGKSSSPWDKDYGAMVRKTAARDLAKWVPTSSEYIREHVRAQQDVSAETTKQAPVDGNSTPPVQTASEAPTPNHDTDTGELIDEGEVPYFDPTAESWGLNNTEQEARS